MMQTISSADYRASLVASKRGKYPVAPKAHRTADGRVFDSKREMDRYLELSFREKILHEIRDLECQRQFKVLIGGRPFCTYSADFAYRDMNSDSLIVEDVKSSGTRKDPAYRLRKRAAELFFGITVIEV